MIIITYMNDYNQGIQICIVFIILAVIQLIHVKNQPYYTDKLNFLQAIALYVCNLFIAARLSLRTFGLN